MGIQFLIELEKSDLSNAKVPRAMFFTSFIKEEYKLQTRQKFLYPLLNDKEAKLSGKEGSDFVGCQEGIRADVDVGAGDSSQMIQSTKAKGGKD